MQTRRTRLPRQSCKILSCFSFIDRVVYEYRSYISFSAQHSVSKTLKYRLHPNIVHQTSDYVICPRSDCLGRWMSSYTLWFIIWTKQQSPKHHICSRKRIHNIWLNTASRSNRQHIVGDQRAYECCKGRGNRLTLNGQFISLPALNFRRSDIKADIRKKDKIINIWTLKIINLSKFNVLLHNISRDLFKHAGKGKVIAKKKYHASPVRNLFIRPPIIKLLHWSASLREWSEVFLLNAHHLNRSRGFVEG